MFTKMPNIYFWVSCKANKEQDSMVDSCCVFFEKMFETLDIDELSIIDHTGTYELENDVFLEFSTDGIDSEYTDDCENFDEIWDYLYILYLKYIKYVIENSKEAYYAGIREVGIYNGSQCGESFDIEEDESQESIAYWVSDIQQRIDNKDF